MSDFTLQTTVHRPYPETVEAVRVRLSEVGFGILTEIDLQATLKEKLGEDIAPQIILGACRPQLAYEAIRADPPVAVLLPCNVVVRSIDEQTTMVEAFDPAALVGFRGGGHNAVSAVADDARKRITAALEALDGNRPWAGQKHVPPRLDEGGPR